MEIELQGGTSLTGDLSFNESHRGLVVFAHGSGSSRLSPRNRWVAEYLNRGGLSTLLFDLLTKAEEEIDLRTRQLRFDVALLASRLVAVTDWLRAETVGSVPKPLGYFGASTGAAAALSAAARRSEVVKAVVSRGGRPDLADPDLPGVRCPTLLIVGGSDEPVIEMNKYALERLTSVKQLEVIPGATHLFEEPGALERVAELATHWFDTHLTR